MKRRWLSLAVLSLAPLSVFAAPQGHLQIQAQDGVEVTIGALRASAKHKQGVIFRALGPGLHRLEAHREGYRPQHATVSIEPGEVTLHRLAPWQFPIKSAGSAVLVIQSLPLQTTIAARSLGYGKFSKGAAPAVLPNLAAGRHKLTLCTAYKCIDYRAEVKAKAVLSLFVDFDSGQVKNLSTDYLASLERLKKGCLVEHRADDCKKACVQMKRMARPSPTCRAAKPMPINAGRDFP